MRPLRVLGAEASAGFRDTILQEPTTLEGCFVVAAAADTEAAAQAALRLEPDVVLLDISICGRSGMKTARQFHLLLPRMRVVLLLSDDPSAEGLYIGAAERP